MGIDLSLVATSRTTPTERRAEADTLLAYARAFIPLGWALLFDPEDVVPVRTPSGLIPTLFTRAESALHRLRTRGPHLRAAAGAHADGLALLEAALSEAPHDTHVQLFVDELLNTWADDTRRALQAFAGNTAATLVSDWREALSLSGTQVKDGRLALAEHSGPLASAVSGQVLGNPPVSDPHPRQPPSLAWAWTEQPLLPMNPARSVATALDHVLLAHDQLDVLTTVLLVDETSTPQTAATLERVLIDAIQPALAPYKGLQRRSWRGAQHHPGLKEAAAQVAEDLVAGRPASFDPLRQYPRPAAAEALSRARPRRYAPVRKALRGMTEPLAAPLAVAVECEADCPAAVRLALFTWCEDGTSPHDASDPDVLLARRIAALGTTDRPLCAHDPLATIERLAANHVRPWRLPPLSTSGPLIAFALARALSCTRSLALASLHTAPRDAGLDDPPPDDIATLETLRQQLLSWSCALFDADLDPRARARLLERARRDPPDAFLTGIDRRCVQLALGDLGEAPTVLDAIPPGADRATAVVNALRSSGAGRAAIPWLQRAAENDVEAALLLLAAAPDDGPSRAVALPVLARLPSTVETTHRHFDEGMLTPQEYQAVLDLAERVMGTLEAQVDDRDAPAAELLVALRAALLAGAQRGEEQP
ncbi:hypothetical protein [Chondromyces crocatus]|uniref:Uncharacterized protein n=1 Tax=Chondromyces crocatus TaxID=52 RepID=A0A0K1ERS3_CHOCO|nr:hypothetical protein [Chondromyces crocatus]AKT43318.1 uncharacterized protein CMC5_075500 [Chondromyces crocatus]